MTPEEIRRLRRIYGEGLNEPLEKMDLSGSNLKDPYEPKLSINQRPGIWDEKYKHDKFLKSRESISCKPHLFAGDTNKIPLTFFYEDKLSIDYFNKKIPKTLFGEKEPRKLIIEKPEELFFSKENFGKEKQKEETFRKERH